MLDEIMLKPMQLYALFNWLCKGSHCNVEIESVWSKEPIISMRFNEQIASASVIMHFTSPSFRFFDDNEGLTRFELLKTVAAAGVIKPRRWKKTIDDLVKFSKRDLFRGERPFCIAFDTNALINRYYTLVDRELLRFVDGKQHMGWGYVITQGILEELATFEKKYKDADIQRLTKTTPCNWFDYTTFARQLVGKSRMFRLGSVEAHKMMNDKHCFKISSGRGDDEIISSLSFYQSDQGIDLFAISEDSDFISMCNYRGIQGGRLDPPTAVGSEKIDNVEWRELADLIYILAIRLGAIRLKYGKGQSCVIKGIWTGKKIEPWNNEMIMFMTEDSDLDKWVKHYLRVYYNA